ncbi:YjiH family protein [Virgibacillus ihumii]|uniref:YjiH family protein n=1 Tax=Virgibacillus ihumii TaxID=2686091 RepID=UPI00157D41F3|nr:YjiH family protein [Virgibacillus ihumii]
MSEKQISYETPSSEINNNIYRVSNVLKFLVYSLIGIFMFFIPVKINGTSSIPLDHIVTWLNSTFPSITPLFALLVILGGAIYPFATKTWNTSKFNVVFSILKVLGLIIGLALYFNVGPSWLLTPNMGPYLFDNLVVPVGITVPLGGVLLALLVGYGLLEFVGVLGERIMQPIWKTPGRSAINALASFVASFAVGLLITNREYKEGKFTVKQSVIIATGFSTVTVAFMIVVAKTLELMHIWNLYFWTTLFVTFAVTAVTVRIWPISKMSDKYYNKGQGEPDEKIQGEYLKNAWKNAMVAANNAPSLARNIWDNLRDGMVMTMSILPTILSIGLICLALAEYTPLFGYLGYIFYPITALLQIPEPFLAAKAAAIGITEMFLPALLVVGAPLITKFIISVVCVSSIIFFSASVPSILSTEIPISIPKLIIIWFERTIISLIIVTPIAFLLL